MRVLGRTSAGAVLVMLFWGIAVASANAAATGPVYPLTGSLQPTVTSPAVTGEDTAQGRAGGKTVKYTGFSNALNKYTNVYLGMKPGSVKLAFDGVADVQSET